MKLYRYTNHNEIGIDDRHHTVRVTCEEYPILRETPFYFFVKDYINGERKVRKGARKAFALPTKAEAIKSFQARKLRQISILKSRMEDAQMALLGSEIISVN